MKENGIVTKKEVLFKSLVQSHGIFTGRKVPKGKQGSHCFDSPTYCKFLSKVPVGYMCQLTPQLFFEIKKHQFSIG